MLASNPTYFADLFRKAATGTVVNGRWLRHAVGGYQLARLPFHRRGVLGQAMDPDPALQLLWGMRTRASRAMWVAGLEYVDSWYANHCLLGSWPPAVLSVLRD